MKYTRPEFNDPSVPVIEVPGFGGVSRFPQYERPISIRENLVRAYTRNNPMWVPNRSVEVDAPMFQTLNGMPEADFSSKVRYDWVDWYGVDWTFVPEAGGPMLKTGTQFMDDILDWEKKVKFPVLDDYDWEGLCAKFMEKHDPEKPVQVDIGLGATERLVSLLGGYTDAMLAMAEEPEAVRDLLEAFADWEISVIDRLMKNIPLDVVLYHDDWGTERDTFFSEKMMEEIVFEPTKRIFQHVKKNNMCMELHSCGHIERFIPYMIDMGVDLLQIQARCNDIASYKEKYGDKIGFDLMVMPKPGDTKEDVVQQVRELIDTYGAGGGLYSTVFSRDPELVWYASNELYYYSREKYEAEQGK